MKVDLHSHIIPGVDDGVQTVDELLETLAALQQEGVTMVFCTSHLNSTAVECKAPQQLKEGFATVEQSCPPGLRAVLGCEYYWDPRLHDRHGFRPIPLGSSRYVLMELPYEADLALLRQSVEDCLWAGWLPVIAHAERDDAFHTGQYEQTLHWAAEQGVLLQLNAFSLTASQALKENGKAAWRIVEAGQASFLGTDTHGQKRPPVYAGGQQALTAWAERSGRQAYGEDVIWRNAEAKLLDPQGMR